MLTKTEIKQLLKENNMRPLKRWGQNFLIDKNIKDKIIRLADIKSTDIVLEIGPGLGALTEDLAKKAEKVLAVEKDSLLCRILKERLCAYKNTEIIEADILKYPLPAHAAFQKQPLEEEFCESKKLKVIGNLPYYITSPAIIHLLELRGAIDSILITVQKEVARRIIASPGTKDYGSLSLFVNFYTTPFIEMNIPPDAFFPRPKVSSSLLRLSVRKKPAVAVKDEQLLFEVIRAAFGQRRKTLANTLKQFSPEIKKIMESVNIDPKRRGETLSMEEFAKLVDMIDNSAYL